MKRLRIFLAVLVVATLAITVRAVTMPKVQYTEATLPNGLRVVISSDRAAPVVSMCVAYDVGSRNEKASKTGYAHFFEHMMYKGSANVGDGELAALIENYGGDHNGQTDKDHTIYFEEVPANQLDMILFLEADRMKALALTREGVDNQREAVKEERRFRYDNQPYGTSSLVMDELAFQNFANQHSVIGSMTDLDAATIQDFADFFKTYYAPNNAVVAIAGDVEPKVALEKVQKYFGGIPSQPAPQKADTAEPPQREEKRKTVEDPLARLVLIDAGYHIPGGLSPDMDALNALSSILGSGRSSRLYDSLVRQKQLAVQIYTGSAAQKGPGLFYVEAVAAPGKPVADVEAAMYAEIEKIKSGQIQDWELEKARNAAKRSLVGAIRNSLQRAILLARYSVFYNDPGVINTRYERIAAVTAADVQRVARQYLVPANRTVVITTPKAAAPARGTEPPGAGRGTGGGR
ncbi:MAG TPA: pitrilysin family protein [Vicinamibacterales bacterium]|jgi:predicted Zn-dependent peptidase|nr:pitrilysin family protein [Vicinamibacterales bacterium]